MQKFIKFGLVGLVNTGSTMIIFNILHRMGVNYIVANSIGYVCGMANSYLWNNKWVFKSERKDITTVVKFIIVNLIVMGINNVLLILLVNNIGVDTVVAQVIALVITTIINFLGNKLWTFNK